MFVTQNKKEKRLVKSERRATVSVRKNVILRDKPTKKKKRKKYEKSFAYNLTSKLLSFSDYIKVVMCINRPTVNISDNVNRIIYVCT